MSDFYGTLLENAARAPQAPCHLEAPLREVWNGLTQFDAHGKEAPLLAAQGRLVILDEARHAVALDPASQERLWRFPWRSLSSPFLHEGQLFHWVSDTDLQLVDLETGRPSRSIHAQRAEQAVASGKTVVGYALDYEHHRHRLYALDWSTGRRLWSEALGKDQEVEGVMTASPDVLVCALAEGGPPDPKRSIVARRLDTGAELWRKPGLRMNGMASIHRERVVIPTLEGLQVLATRDGSVAWQAKNLGGGYLYGDLLYTCSWGKYLIVDVRTGRKVRGFNLKARLPGSLQDTDLGGVMLVSETHVYLSASNNRLVAFTRDTGRYVWSHLPKQAHLRGVAACVGGRLYYKNGARELYCLEPRG